MQVALTEKPGSYQATVVAGREDLYVVSKSAL